MAKTLRCKTTGIQLPTHTCPTCNGTGSVPSGHLSFFGIAYQDCDDCRGNGATLAPLDDPQWAIFDAEYDLWEEVHQTAK